MLQGVHKNWVASFESFKSSQKTEIDLVWPLFGHPVFTLPDIWYIPKQQQIHVSKRGMEPLWYRIVALLKMLLDSWYGNIEIPEFFPVFFQRRNTQKW